jgi:hypothetical protein
VLDGHARPPEIVIGEPPRTGDQLAVHKHTGGAR